MKIKKCPICGKDFEPQYKGSKYCSAECAKTAYNAKRKKRRHRQSAENNGVSITEYENKLYGLRFCARFGCHNQFVAKIAAQKYCCPECARLDKVATESARKKRIRKKYGVQRMCKYDFVHRLKNDLAVI